MECCVVVAAVHVLETATVSSAFLCVVGKQLHQEQTSVLTIVVTQAAVIFKFVKHLVEPVPA